MSDEKKTKKAKKKLKAALTDRVTFIVKPYNGGEQDWPFTNRNRFAFYRALVLVMADAEQVRDKWQEASESYFPRISWSQPSEWWDTIVRRVDRLADALRVGEKVTSENMADDVIVLIADRLGMDGAEMYQEDFDALPEHEDDGVHDMIEVLVADTDAVALWDPAQDGMSNDDRPEMGIADMSIGAWFTPFYTDHVEDDEFAASIEASEDMRYQAEVIGMTVRNALEAFHGGGTPDLISDEAMAVINKTVRNGAVTALHALYNKHPRTVDWVSFQRMVKPDYWEAPELLPEYVEFLQANGGESGVLGRI